MYDGNRSKFNLQLYVASDYKCACVGVDPIDEGIDCDCENYPIKKIRLSFSKKKIISILNSTQLELF
jgi:hypothetical protein